MSLKGEAVTREEAETAIRKARQARALQPDAGPKLLEWLLLDLIGRHRQALPLLEDVARNEPANAHAWFLLAEKRRDAAGRRSALRRFRQLRPRRAERR